MPLEATLLERTPIIGITTDIIPYNGRERHAAPVTYARAVRAAGGMPVLLPPGDGIDQIIHRVDGLVLTGGDDPIMEAFGVPTHPAATKVRPERQAAEIAILGAIEAERPGLPILGVCLGMQMMTLVRGGSLDQHLPDTLGAEAAALHWDHGHEIEPVGDDSPIPKGVTFSRHRQAMGDPGELRTCAVAGRVIEAVWDPNRPFCIGVQWHPELTTGPLGQDLYNRLVQASASESSTPSAL